MADTPAGFAGLLRHLRDSAGLTQEELADRARVGVNTISELERGRHLRCQVQTARRLAAALGLSGPFQQSFIAAARGLIPATALPSGEIPDKPLQAGVPAAGPGAGSPQKPARPLTLPPKPRITSAVLMATATVAALAAAGVSVMWPRAAQSAQPVTAARATHSDMPYPVPTVNDGDDPRVDGCASADDAQQAALGSIANPFVPITDAAGHVIGDLGIWHNARCRASWAEASYRNPGLYRTIISLHRPADGAAVVTDVTANLPYDPVIGQLLRDTGCVWADIKVEITGGITITAKTSCEI